MTTLYELKGRAHEIALELEHTEDTELRDLLLDELDALHGALDDKLEAYCVVIKNLAAEEYILDEEAKRLKKRADKLAATRESILARLKACIEEGHEFRRGAHAFKWRKSTQVRVIDEKLIPTAYMREIISYEPDKKQITQDLKMKAIIPGVELLERKNLTIE